MKTHRRQLRARGTEEFWVPAVLAAVSAGGQAINQSNANARQQNAETEAIDAQEQYRQQANDQVKALTQQINQNTPQQIQNSEQAQFVNQLRQNQAGSAAGGSTSNDPNNFGAPVSALGNTAGASKAFKASADNSQKETQQYGNTEAKQLSALDAAVRQRQNEGLAMNTLQTNLNTLGQASAGTGFVNQLRAQTAGETSPWATLFSNILGGTANTAAKNGWFAPSSTPTATAAQQAYGASQGPAGNN